MLEGWRCACRSPAWTGDGTLCYDVDECRVGLAGCDQECVNTQGGYSCRCYPGFALDAVDRRSCAQSQSAQQDDSASSENTWFDDAYVIAVIVLVFLSGIVLVCVAFALSRHAAAESFADEQRAEEAAARTSPHVFETVPLAFSSASQHALQRRSALHAGSSKRWRSRLGSS